jgi:hypothetical protein
VPTGRPESPINLDSPCSNLAGKLRALRKRCRVTYREMEGPASYSKSQLSEAASGRRRPSWILTKAYVTACFALGMERPPTPSELEEWHQTWDEGDAGDTEGES